MITRDHDEPCGPTQGMHHCHADSSGVNDLGSPLPTRLTIAIDTQAGYLDEVALGICHAVLLELGNWELIAKGVHFSIEYPPSYVPPGRPTR